MAYRRSSACLSFIAAVSLLCVFMWSCCSFVAPAGQLRGSSVKAGSNVLASGSPGWIEGTRLDYEGIPMNFFGGVETTTTTTTPPPAEEGGLPLIYIVLIVDVLIFAADKAGLIVVPVLHDYWAKS
eukprot:TRINITY_DN65436_c0_g1_i1.p1 TRINITY_DN65436_c0_g1~~TRINITY_DN65436_c0_g1_i1.p1  ORF type:complete len:126 (+),score=12.75 TRINITY_DN65436_c0_g1_i1:67-444(+)